MALLTLGALAYLLPKGYLLRKGPVQKKPTEPIWEAHLEENSVDEYFFAYNDTVFCVGYTATDLSVPFRANSMPAPVTLYALDAGSGQLRWKRQLQHSSLGSHHIGDQSLMIGASTIGFCSLDGVFHMLDSNTGDPLWQADGRFLLSGASGGTIYAFDGRGHKIALERGGTIRAATDQEFVPAPTVKELIRTINGIFYSLQSTAHYNEVSKRLLRSIGEKPEIVLSNDSAVALIDVQTDQIRWLAEPVWGDMVSPFPWNGYIYAGVAQPAKAGSAYVLAYRDPLATSP
jgi:hypothetical protein